MALTEAQIAAHADLDPPIARLVNQARRRPLTQAEFLRLMQLLTQQRMITGLVGDERALFVGQR